MACSTGDEHTNIEPDGVWDVTVNGMSHTTLNILFDVASNAGLSRANDWSCRFEITGAEVQWLKAQYQVGNRVRRKADYEERLAWFVAYDRQSDKYIASTGFSLLTPEGMVFELSESQLDDVELFIEQKEREVGCRDM